MVENLLENAISFSPEGESIGVRLESARRHGRAADRRFAARACRREDLDRIFDRYFSQRPPAAEAATAEPHFGIGLWIARRNVEALGGTIRAENRKPSGLLMRVRLPLAGPRAAPCLAARPNRA